MIFKSLPKKVSALVLGALVLASTTALPLGAAQAASCNFCCRVIIVCGPTK